ncbi:MAG TPA: hypothetical protein VGI39_04030 [Polyangiaceae bacterium]|jgi:hypothetical protein
MMKTKTLMWTPGAAAEPANTRALPADSQPPGPAPEARIGTGTLRLVPDRVEPAAPSGTITIPPAAAVPSPATPVPPSAAVPVIAPPPALPRELAPARPAVREGVHGLNKVVVSAYKLVGFAILGTILFGLLSFIATNLFYLVNTHWVTPLTLSATDPRVLQLNAQYAAEQAARDGVATQRLDVGARLEDAQRTAVSEEAFQHAFEDAMSADLADRNAELAMFQKLSNDVERTRHDVNQSNAAFAAVSRDELAQQYAARLINKDQQTKGGFELAQIAGANVALHEKNVEVSARVTELRRAVSSLKSGGQGQMSYEILHMRHEFDQSLLASRKAQGDAEALSQSATMMDKTLAQYDAQLARIAKAPYLMASDKNVSTVFIPYDNVGDVKAGEPLYSCALGFLFCKKVGMVAEVLDGEVMGTHPLHNHDLRGVLARVSLDDPTAIRKPVLHLGHKPVGL